MNDLYPLTPDKGFVFQSGKVYTHAQGLSAAFRQWRAESHCRFLHGYALQIECTFEAEELDGRNWVVDFGGLKTFKAWLEDTFDHKTLVAQDDPSLKIFQELHTQRIIELRIVPNTGCEAFAWAIYQYLDNWLYCNGYSNQRIEVDALESPPEDISLTKCFKPNPRVKLVSVKVSEHGGNFATYMRKS